jgi:hypothetical protein
MQVGLHGAAHHGARPPAVELHEELQQDCLGRSEAAAAAKGGSIEGRRWEDDTKLCRPEPAEGEGGRWPHRALIHPRAVAQSR